MATIDLLKSIIQIDSQSKNISGINSLQKLIQNELSSLPLYFSKLRKNGAPDFLICKTKTNNPNLPRILLSLHVDTVFNTKDAKYKIEKKKIFGAGASDMKIGIAVVIEALKRLFENTGVLQNIVVIFSPEEEIATPNYREVIKQEAEKAHYALVFEATKNYFKNKFVKHKRSVVVARRGFEQLALKVSGTGGHSGTITNKENRNSAIQFISKFILGLEDLCDYKKLTTANVGIINGGSAVNVLSPNCEIKFEIRFKDKVEHKRMRTDINTLISKLNSDNKFKVELTPFGFFPPLEESFQNIKLARLIQKEGKKLGITVEIERRAGGSESSLIQYFNPQIAVVDGMGGTGDLEHTCNEFAYIESLEEAINMTMQIIAKIGKTN